MNSTTAAQLAMIQSEIESYERIEKIVADMLKPHVRMENYEKALDDHRMPSEIRLYIKEHIEYINHLSYLKGKYERLQKATDEI
jgi:hypothetical protein